MVEDIDSDNQLITAAAKHGFELHDQVRYERSRKKHEGEIIHLKGNAAVIELND